MGRSQCAGGSSRPLYVVLLSLFVFCVVVPQRAEAQGYHNIFNQCDIPGTDCEDWQYVSVGVFLPEYPNCIVDVFYWRRLCPPSNPYQVNQEEQIVLDFILWPDMTDTNHPCFGIQQDYLYPFQQVPPTTRPDFLRHLFFESLEAVVRYRFDTRYPQDSIAAIVNPTQENVDRYTEQICGEGKKYYRAIHGGCSAPFVHENYEFGPAGTEGEGDSKGAEIAGNPPHHKWNRVRYVSCNVTGPCCIQEFELCRDTLTGQTVATVTAVPLGVSVDCDSVTVSALPEPGETIYSCRPYCEDRTPVRVEDGSDPNLARIEPAGLQGKRREQE